jgi:hypothetical protein
MATLLKSDAAENATAVKAAILYLLIVSSSLDGTNTATFFPRPETGPHL